jgi:hypothetical protein
MRTVILFFTQLWEELRPAIKEYPLTAFFTLLFVFSYFYTNRISKYLRDDDIWIDRNEWGWCIMANDCNSEQDLRGSYTECEDIVISDSFDTYEQAFKEKRRLLNWRKKELESRDFLNLRLLPILLVNGLYLIFAGLALASYIREENKKDV